jgi:membrane-associated phospholipid phosphatase
MYHLWATTRKLVIGFSIFIVYWVLYDYMKAFPNYNYHPVSIAALYNLEKALFSLQLDGMLITPNEYWLIHSNAFLDVLCGLFYLCWIPVPLAFSVFLFFSNRKQFFYFSLTFLLVNLLGFIVYYLYPAAPPWYVQQYGFGFQPLTLGNTAGLARFDGLLGITLFESIYSKGSNVFAAMPSLHSAYPVVVLYFGFKSKLGLVNIFFAIVSAGIWFAAVYTSHHYIVDVIAGIICAFSGIAFFHYLVHQSPPLRVFIERLTRTSS